MPACEAEAHTEGCSKAAGGLIAGFWPSDLCLSDPCCLVQEQTSSGVAGLLAAAVLATSVSAAQAADYAPPPQAEARQQASQTDSRQFQGQNKQAPEVYTPPKDSSQALPEGNNWRYSEFIGAVQNGKVERVRFSKDGSQLQLTAVDGR